jgi:TonB family protein
MFESPDIVAAGVSAVGLPPNAVLRQVRGSFFRTVDPRFFGVVLLSLAIHSGIILYFNTVKLPPKPTMDIEKVPERFARLIIEKPIPKVPLAVKQKPLVNDGQAAAKSSSGGAAPKTGAGTAASSTAERAHARTAVAARSARVEQMIRSVGVLGMLTGVGSTARGPSVVDVLGAMGSRKESTGSLDDALQKMSGLRRTGNVEVLDRKLVKSKDVGIEHKQEIDDLIASVGTAKSVDLVKRGEFVIQRPESIEGAASSNVKRDNAAINAVVATHKVSLRMSYEKFLKRDPALSGKITARFTIAASGVVSTVTILENTTGNTELEQEIIRKIRMWQFDPISEGDVNVTYPFVFLPAAG